MSRITDGSGIPLDPSDIAKLREMGAEIAPTNLAVKHYLSLALDRGTLEYDVECVDTANGAECTLAGEYEGCGYNEWLTAAGIENTHAGMNKLGTWPVDFDFEDDDILMTFI